MTFLYRNGDILYLRICLEDGIKIIIYNFDFKLKIKYYYDN